MVSSIRAFCFSQMMLLALCAPGEAAFIIGKGATQNVTCDNYTGVCSAIAADAVLSVRDLTRLLRAVNVTLKSGSAADIDFRVPFSWSRRRQLTFDANGSVIVRQPIVVQGLGGVSITGRLVIRESGRIDFTNLSSSLSINGYTYFLVNSVAMLAQYGDGMVALAADYDAANDGTYSSAPVSSTYMLEGLGHTISNLTVQDTNTAHDVGLVASATYGTFISDLGLVNANISGGSQSNVGGLIGSFGGNGTIRNSYVTGTVTGGNSAAVGGLAGSVDSGSSNNAIVDSWSSAAVSGDYDARVGGLLGEMYGAFSAKVHHCHATGDVSVAADGKYNGNYIGGLSGNSSSGEIVDSYATGSVSGGAESFAGGLTGYSARLIQRSFATGTVLTGDKSDAGGLIGYAGGGKVEQAYASGSATAGNDGSAGGLVGDHDYGVIGNSYATGAASVGSNGYVGSVDGQAVDTISKSYGTGAVSGGTGSTIGGFVGLDYAGDQVSHADWDTDTTGITKRGQGAGNSRHAPGIKGLSSAELQAGLPKGFSPSIWGQDAQLNNGFPYLLAVPPQQTAARR